MPRVGVKANAGAFGLGWSVASGVEVTGGTTSEVGGYDETRDAFIPPKPYPSWLLNEDTCLWDAPVPYPTDGEMYTWDEDGQTWVAVEQPA